MLWKQEQVNLYSESNQTSPEVFVLFWCLHNLLLPRSDRPEPDHVFRAHQLDWNRFLDLARLHATTPLIHEFLSRLDPGLVPESIMVALDEHRKALACVNLKRTGELVALLSALQRESLPVMCFKGPVLAQCCYRNLSLREFGDLDLLVRKDDTEACATVIKAQGYKHTLHYAWEDTFRKPGQCEVDLHWSLSPRTFPISLPFQRWWEYRQKVRFADTNAYTFCPEHNVLALCIQLSKDAWEDRLTLNKLCDLAALLNTQKIDWKFVLGDASMMHVSRIMCFGIAVTLSFFPISVPEFIRTEIGRYTWIDKRVQETRHRVIKATGIGKHGTLRRMQLHFCLQEQFVGKLSQLGVPFIRARKLEE